MKFSKTGLIIGFDGKPSSRNGCQSQMLLPLEVEGYKDYIAPWYVVDKLGYDFVVGKGWMQKHRVYIDTAREALTFEEDFCNYVGAPYVDKKLRELRNIFGAPLNIPHQKLILEDQTEHCPDDPRHQTPLSTEPPLDVPKDPDKLEFDGRGMRICKINGPAFATLVKKPEIEIFAVTMKDI